MSEPTRCEMCGGPVRVVGEDSKQHVENVPDSLTALERDVVDAGKRLCHSPTGTRQRVEAFRALYAAVLLLEGDHAAIADIKRQQEAIDDLTAALDSPPMSAEHAAPAVGEANWEVLADGSIVPLNLALNALERAVVEAAMTYYHDETKDIEVVRACARLAAARTAP